MKQYWIFPCLFLLAFSAQAQRKNKKQNDNQTVINTPRTLRRPQTDAPKVNLNFLPLYGGYQRSTEEQQKDQAFLADCDRNFSNREEASKFFETRAWEYLQEGKLDTATYRFNLAWLLNNKNVNTYWGLGSISSMRGKNDEAIGLLEKGLTLEPNSAPLMVDIATLHLNNYRTKNDKKELDNSQGILEKAIQSDSTYAGAYTKLSMVYYYQENYDKAWEYLHKSRQLDMGSMDFNYLTELLARKEDPMGIFK